MKKIGKLFLHDPSLGYDDDKIEVVCLLIILKSDIENRLKHRLLSQKFKFSPSERVKFQN